MMMLASSLAGCGDDGPDTAETGADDGASTAETATGDATAMVDDSGCTEPPQLHIVNQDTGNAVEEITMLACDMSDQSSFPVPPGGLTSGGELTIDLPGPGCWVLQ